MDRLASVFAAVVLLSVVLGGVSAVGFADTLITSKTTTLVSDAVTVEARDVTLREEALSVTVVIRNPTVYDIRATGAFFQVYDGQNDRLAYGSAIGFDSVTVPSHGQQVLTFTVPLTPAQVDRLRHALRSRNGFVLQSRYGMILDGVEFVVYADKERVTGEEET